MFWLVHEPTQQVLQQKGAWLAVAPKLYKHLSTFSFTSNFQKTANYEIKIVIFFFASVILRLKLKLVK